MKQLALFAALLWGYASYSQNLTVDPTLSGRWANWDESGCHPIIGSVYGHTGAPYWFENVYGGPTNTNLVAHVNGGACLQQIPNLVKGLSYRINFKAQRRCEADNPDVPATVSIQVRVMGTTSFTIYSEVIYSYTNTSWNWSNETQDFTIPAGASDNSFYFSITAYNSTTEHNVVVDDVMLSPIQTVAVNGPTAALPGSGTNWAVQNLPATGVTYNWSFPGATPSSSTLANPTNVQWPTQGVKTVSCVIGNSAGAMVTITQDVTITSALPVSLTSFTATEKQGAVELLWNTTDEINNDYFAVYKSKDGVNFAEIGRVKASGIASGATYRFTDVQPGSGLAYYRLRQVDKNAAYKLSSIVKLRLGVSGLDVNVYPTIVTGTLNYAVETPRAAKMKVMITDMSGRTLIRTAENCAAGTNTKALDVNTLAKGIYLLTLFDDAGFKKTISFTKN
jgi:Secretion system C-terminal sorting domain